MTSTQHNDENKCITINDKISVTEKFNLFHLKKKNSSFLLSKVSYDNVYTKKPIFRRKLIEKYSTTRYNLNTKLIYSSPKFLKRKLKRNLGSKCLSNKTNFNKLLKNFKCTSSTMDFEENQDHTTTDRNMDYLKAASSSVPLSSNINTNVETKTQKSDFSRPSSSGILTCLEITEKLMQKNIFSDSNISFDSPDCDKELHSDNNGFQGNGIDLQLSTLKNVNTISVETSNLNDNSESECRSFNNDTNLSFTNDKTPKLNLIEKTTNPDVSAQYIKKNWKLVPTNIYDYFSDLYKKNKTERKKKKRKNYWTKNKKNQYKFKNKYYSDPFIDCLNEPIDTNFEHIDDNVGLILHLGVNRPLFPLVYRNIVALSKKKDSSEITNLWANFSLSTLITKPTDVKVKPILMPVKDAKLMSTVLEYKNKAQFEFEEIEFKQVKKVNESNSLLFPSLEKPQNVITNLKHQKPKHPVYPKNVLQRSTRLCYKKNKNKSKGEDLVKNFPYNNNTDFEDDDEILRKHGYKQCYVVLPKCDLLEVGRMKMTSNSIKGNLIKKHRTRNKTNLMGNKSHRNHVKTCFDNVSSEPVSIVDSIEKDHEEKHFFGQEHCTRTYGSMIDFTLRNRSLVYFYKMKRILKFQKQNNKLFQQCFYSRIHYDVVNEQNIRVDILSEMIYSESNVQSSINEKVQKSEGYTLNNNRQIKVNTEEIFNVKPDAKQASQRFEGGNVIINKFNDEKLKIADILRKEVSVNSSCNPLDVFKFHDLHNYEEQMLKNLEPNSNMVKFPIHFVDTNVLNMNVKWLILRLNKSLVTIIYKRQHVLPVELLFQIICRADLTKKVVRSTLEGEIDTNKLEFGVYGVPGLCEAVLLGPYKIFEKCHEISAMINSVYNEVVPASVVEASIKDIFFCKLKESKVSEVCVAWWNSNNLLQIPYINTSLLNFHFVRNGIQQLKKSDDKIIFSDIFSKHNCTDYKKYEVKGFEVNYIFYHDNNNRFEAGNIIEDNTKLRRINNKTVFNHENNEKEKLRREELARYREILCSAIESTNLSHYSMDDLKNISLVDLLTLGTKIISILKMIDKKLTNEKQKLEIIRGMLLHKFSSHLKNLEPTSKTFEDGKLILSHLFKRNKAKHSESVPNEENKYYIFNDHSSSERFPSEVTNCGNKTDTYAAKSYFDQEKLVESSIFKNKRKISSNFLYDAVNRSDSLNSKPDRRIRWNERNGKRKKYSQPPANNKIEDKVSVKSVNISEHCYSLSTVDAFEISRNYSLPNEKTSVKMPNKKSADENSDPNNVKLVFKELNKLLINLKKMQPQCPICLGNIESRCYLNKCLHSYCLRCVSEWSKTRLSCPSCGQKYRAVFYNVRSVRSYQIKDFTPKSKRNTCLLRSMNTIDSYFEVKETLSRILSKYDLTFDMFHSKVVLIDT